MNRLTLSIISEIVIFLIGALFLFLAVTTLKSSGTFYKSAGYYPILLSSCIIVVSAYGLVSDLIKRRRERDDKVDLGSMKSFVLVLGIMVAMELIWKLLALFYVSMALGISGILYLFHDTGRPKRRRLIFAVIVGVGFTVVAYITFAFILKINI
ncbi:tripartite tricarboxylate transporter TctB family protein [Candidatus Formimonas warabiya]|uniref:DUF1468 domain-containing protein n=1 Tax=Formimonas warabiya TaxID=1761012 RepID=A0A3G1KTT9_FORW1|nr:tripartite tricarboxylate transporter TctB family protein [Candidatus Formimonas warabiya]ATW25866.1 hypothetical protein DCMF_14785 [Candidatus Formimonas warabiya]